MSEINEEINIETLKDLEKSENEIEMNENC